MILLDAIDSMSILTSLLFFSVGSYFDLKSREVSDRVWMVYAPIAVALTAFRLVIEPSTLLLTAISGVFTFLVAFGMFYFGMFGGADAKAMFCLGASIPLVPGAYQTVIGFAYPFFPIVVMVTSYFCSASIILWVGFHNVLYNFRSKGQLFSGLHDESRAKKILAFITGYPTEQARLRSIFYLYPMEEVIQTATGARRSLRAYVSAEEDRDESVRKLTSQLDQIGYRGDVWVTPGLPHLVFLLIGLIVSLTLGDPIFGTIVKLAAR
jgi:preflagellin peptidase FlaK